MKHDYDLKELQTISVRGLQYNIMPRYAYHYVDQDYENFSLDLLDRIVEAGGTSIDIGAHYGIYSLLAAKKSKKVYAFEPVPENFKILEKNIKDNKFSSVIQPINKAVSDKAGKVNFNITWASDSAGFYQHPNAEVIRTIDVEMNSVDNELNNLKDISFIKIDTEGHEVHVLNGLKKTLKDNKQAKLLIEFNPGCLRNAGFESKDLLQKIQDLGYDIFALYEQERYIAQVNAQTSEEDILRGESYLNLLCLPKESWRSTLFLSHNSGIGGAELVLFETVKNLIELKGKFIVPLIVLPGEGPLVEKFRTLPVAIKVLPMGLWVNSNQQEEGAREQTKILNIDALAELTTVYQQFKPQVAQTNSIVIPWGSMVAKSFGVPHVWSIHEYGDLDHGFEFDYGYKESCEFISTNSDVVIVNSKAVQKHVGRFIPQSKMELLYYNAVEPQLSKQKLTSVYSAKAKVKLMVSGRVSPTKCQLDAVKALKLIRDRGHEAELMIMGEIGSDTYLQEINDYCKQHKLTSFVHVIGFKPNPHDYVDMTDIYLMPSNNEAFGRVTVEAMLLGKPVVGSNSGGTTEIVQDGKSGYLYRPHDIESMADKIETLINKKQISSFGENAQVFAQKTFQNNYYKEFAEILYKTKSSPLVMAELRKDLLLGLAGQKTKQTKVVSELKANSQAELQKFSQAYNEVYEAYNQVESRLAAIHSRKSVKLLKKVSKLRPRKTRHRQ